MSSQGSTRLSSAQPASQNMGVSLRKRSGGQKKERPRSATVAHREKTGPRRLSERLRQGERKRAPHRERIPSAMKTPDSRARAAAAVFPSASPSVKSAYLRA